MVTRRGPRPAFLPAHVIWIPLLLIGIWLTFGLEADAVDQGRGESKVEVVLPNPAVAWEPSGLTITGIVILVVAVVAWGFAIWQPRRRGFLRGTRYPMFALAFFLFALGASLSRWRLDGHVLEAGVGGVSWRFIAAERSGILNEVTTWALLVLAVGSLVMSYGLHGAFKEGEATA